MADLTTLFSFNPGDGASLHMDPFAVERGMILAFAKQGQTEGSVLGLCRSANPVQQAEGAMVLEAVAREVFGLVPFNGRTGEGCSPSAAVDIYWAFCEFRSQKKTEAASPPISPRATGPESSECPLPAPSESSGPSTVSG